MSKGNELLAQEHMISTPIEEGDAGVVIKKDMSFQIFNTHDIKPGVPFSDVMMKQGEMLIGLSVALKHPAVMQMLVEMSNDPELCSQDRLVARRVLH